MEETDDICFVCDKTIPSGKWKYKLQVTATKQTNVPVADLIKELVGDEFAVLVGERDAVCSRCMNLLNLMDSLAVQLGEVQTTLSQLLHTKYNLTSERIKIQYDSSVLEEPEPLHKCEECNFETKYEKEFNMHIRTHQKSKSPVIKNTTPKKNTKTTPTKSFSPAKPKKVVEKKIPVKKVAEKKIPEKKGAEKKIPEKKGAEKKIPEKKGAEKKMPENKLAEKKIPEKKVEAKKVSQSTPNLSKSKMNTRATTGSLKRKKYHNSLPFEQDYNKSNEISKSKKTKIFFQCSVCDKMFKSENSVRTHAKKVHGNDKIIVSDEEYEDIQTLESSDEEATALTNSATANEMEPVNILSSPKLDFLDDWEEDEENDDLCSPAKKIKTGDDTSNKIPEIKKKVRGKPKRKSIEYDEDNEDDDSKDTSSKPMCLYCNATFSSIESVQDHVKLSHNDPNSRLNIALKSSAVAPSTDASFEIDSTTDIAENNKQASSNNKLPSKSYKCNLCGIKRVTLQFIQQHIKTHKRKMSLQCKLCGTSFKNIVALKIHASKCHKAASIPKKCGFCKFRFFDLVQLKNHIKKVHHKDLRKISLNSNKKSDGTPLESLVTLKPEKTLQLNESDNSLSKMGSVLGSDTCKISVSEVSSTSLEMEVEPNCLQFACALCNVISHTELEFKEHLEKLHDIKEERRRDEIVKLSLRKIEISAKLECKECNITFARRSRQTDHMNRHKAKTCLNLGICVYCETLYLDKDQAIIHTNIVHDDLKTQPKCPICSKTYSHAKDLKIHYLRVHFSEKADKLIKQVTELKKNKKETVTTSSNDEANDVYSKVFKELQDLTGEGNEIEDASAKRHTLTYSCPLCNYNSLDPGEVNSHLPTHTQNYCNICKNIFNPQESIRHIENHSIEFQGKKCMECDGTFHDEVHLQFHVQSIHPERKPHKCTMCVKSYFSEKSMLSHKQNKHGKKSKKLFSCTKCSLNFYSEKQYETHKEFAHRSSLNCKYCDKTFSDIKKLAIHERNHLKQVKSVYKCNICGKVLKTQAGLKTHKLNHASNKPLHCEVCSQSFKSFHTLREHSASHSDTQEKKYFCDICGKGFYFYDSHYRHRRIHLDPLLFQCKICKERFQTNQKLLAHKTTCTSGTRCTKCSRNFSKISDLKKHLCLPKKNIAL